MQNAIFFCDPCMIIIVIPGPHVASTTQHAKKDANLIEIGHKSAEQLRANTNA